VLLVEQNARMSLEIADNAYVLDDGIVVYSDWPRTLPPTRPGPGACRRQRRGMDADVGVTRRRSPLHPRAARAVEGRSATAVPSACATLALQSADGQEQPDDRTTTLALIAAAFVGLLGYRKIHALRQQGRCASSSRLRQRPEQGRQRQFRRRPDRRIRSLKLDNPRKIVAESWSTTRAIRKDTVVGLEFQA